MAVINRLILKTDTNGVSPSGFSNVDGPLMLRKCEDLLGRAAQGACAANLQLAVAPVAAQATVTATGNGTALDTLTVVNEVITIVTSGAAASSLQINIAGSATLLAAAIAALINGQTNALYTGSTTVFSGICSASAAAGVVTLTALLPGVMGNGLQLSVSSTSLTLTYAWGASVAGSEGTSQTFSVGL